MPDIKPSPAGPPQSRKDETEPALVERTSRSRSWVVPTVVVIVVLVTVIAVGRLGETPSEVIPTALPGPVALATARPTATAPHLILAPAILPPAGLVGQAIGLRRDTNRFVDGIPSSIGGEPVVRVREATVLPIGSTVLVGGWRQEAGCSADDAPCRFVLSDVPARSRRIATLALGGSGATRPGDGPRVVRATVDFDEECAYRVAGTCLPQLRVEESVWEGDEDTNSEPHAGWRIVAAMSTAFSSLDFRPFSESTSCPLEWPSQTYLATAAEVPRAQPTALDVRLVAVFPSAAGLVATAPGLRTAAARMTSFEASNRCVSVPEGVDDKAWVVHDNVLVLLGRNDPRLESLVQAALDA